VCVYGINDDATNNNPALGCRTVTISGTPIGTIDVVSDNSDTTVRVAGWSIDPDTTDSIAVHVYVDGTYATSAVANVSRADVGDAYPSYGAAHGFDLTLADVAAGSHNVCVYGINDDATNNNPALGCRTLTVA
jgi:phage tail protein X